MSTLRDRQLGRIANRLASLLPGAEGGAVYTGARDVLDAEIAGLFDQPVVQRGGSKPPLTYAQALATAAPPVGGGARAATDEALGVLVSGLSSPATLAAGERERLPAETLTADLESLLRVPLLRVIVRTSRPEELLAALASAQSAGEVLEARSLRLGPSVAMRLSFNAARRLLGHPLVLGWQVPGEIVLNEDEAER